MPVIQSVRGFIPKIGENTWVADNATIIGDTVIGENCSIWYSVVIRGDVHSIKIGDETNIQDLTCIHATYKKCGTTIGSRVTVGHSVILHGCTVGDESLIGMGTIIMDHAVIGKNSIVGAGSLVTEESQFEDGWLIMGRPAKAIRKLKEEEIGLLKKSAEHYKLYKSWYEETQTDVTEFR